MTIDADKLREALNRWDGCVAADVENGALHAGTAAAVMAMLGNALREVDAPAAVRLYWQPFLTPGARPQPVSTRVETPLDAMAAAAPEPRAFAMLRATSPFHAAFADGYAPVASCVPALIAGGVPGYVLDPERCTAVQLIALARALSGLTGEKREAIVDGLISGKRTLEFEAGAVEFVVQLTPAGGLVR